MPRIPKQSGLFGVIEISIDFSPIDLKKLSPSFDELFFNSIMPSLSFDKPNSYSEQSIPLDSTPLIFAIFNFIFVLGIVAPGGA